MANFKALRHSWLYEALYNFSGDDSGDIPEDWDDEDINGVSEIISQYYGHGKVVRQTVTNGQTAQIKHDFTSGDKLSGIIEGWFATSNAGNGFAHLYLRKDNDLLVIHLSINLDFIRYFSGGWNNIVAASDRLFYHFSIRFRCTGGDALAAPDNDLAAGKWRVYINEVEYGDFNFVNDTDIDKIELSGFGNAAGTWYIYWDALGWDWDAGYDIGDNIDEIIDDITTNIINARIEEELYQISEGWIIVKGDALSYLPGHEIDFYDINNVLSWIGIILTPEYNIKGSGSNEYVSKIKLIGISSYFDAIYRKNYTTARSSDFILKDIIDTFLTKYHSYDDEIDDFSAITYKYDLKKPILKMLYYFAMLERAVAHNLPNGEMFFNAHDNLMSMFDKYYQGSGGFNDETGGAITSAGDMDWLDFLFLPNTCTSALGAFDNHYNVFSLVHDGGGSDPETYHDFTASATGVYDFWWAISDNTRESRLQLRSGADIGIFLLIIGGTFRYVDSVGASQDTGIVATNNTLIHHKIEWNCATDTFDWYINGVLIEDDAEFRIARDTLSRFWFKNQTAAVYTMYIDAPGLIGEVDPSGLTYVEDDNLGFQITQHLVAEKFAITKYVPTANRYITRAPVIGAYNSNGQVYVVGVAATQAADEEQFGIRQLQAWRDPEITNYTEADQLATNLQIIYFLDTQFIHILSQGRGHIQVGYTMKVRSTLKFEIVAEEFLCLMRIWHPTTDLCEFILSDNILSEAMFNRKVSQKLYDVEAQQSYEDSDVSEMAADGVVTPLVSLALLRSLIGVTPSGRVGYGIWLINKTGAPSIKGTVVQADTTTDFAFKVEDADGDDAIGVVYNDGVPDGSNCLVIVAGVAEVLLKDATAVTHGNWMATHDVAGRADGTAATPPGAVAAHFQEIGHDVESKGADTDVLTECILHFN